MNIKEKIQDELEYWQRKLKEEEEEALIIEDFADHLPEELKELEVNSLDYWSWSKTVRITYSNPDYFKVLKMSGVTGLKQVFYGKYTGIETHWRWEDGRLETPDGYKFEFEITKSAIPTGCRIEHVTETKEITRLVAICPESGEER
jgi:hypothetical protein